MVPVVASYEVKTRARSLKPFSQGPTGKESGSVIRGLNTVPCQERGGTHNAPLP